MNANRLSGSIRIPLLLLATLSLLAGLYGRFRGLGIWPLGVDEFYISRSIDNILRTGLPAFSCGGYYLRGVVYQYLVAGVRLTGLTPEFAGRVIAACCSVATLPAAYLLGRRIHGPVSGWVTVIILSLSIWEIEMARFARMYAPFQAVFVWYLVFYVRYAVDKERAALGWMIALSVLGVLTWEGGVLLGVANIVAVLLWQEQGRLKPADWKRVAALALLLALLFAAGTNDLRGAAEVADAPAGVAAGPAHQALQGLAAGAAAVRQHLVWSCAWLLLFGLVYPTLAWIWSFRRRPLAALSLCAALAAAAAHLFTLAAGVIALSLLMRLIAPGELRERPARYLLMSLVGYGAFWLAFYHWSGAPASEALIGGRGAMPALVQHLFGFPDIYDPVLRPWLRTIPLLSILLGVALLALFVQSLGRGERAGPIAALLTLILVMVLIIGATSIARIETRYTFFLYPVCIALAVAAAMLAVQWLRLQRGAALLAAAAAPLLCFGASEDFQPRHLLAIDSGPVNFRVGMSAVQADHYYPRNDLRAVAEWLAAHVRPGDLVITGIPNLAEYYNGFDYFYLDARDNRYDAYLCRDQRTERWSNHPLLTTAAALQPFVAAGRRIFAIVYPDVQVQLRSAAAAANWSVTHVWNTRYGDTDILLIAERAPAAP